MPDDLCQSPHWGYVLKGRLTYRSAGGDEVIDAGEAFYVAPGHTLLGAAGTELVFFSPTREWEETAASIGQSPATTAS